ncbi:alpha/beta hydrolase (plasmid) [Polymorphobacter sp. PAMC 29334]|uniref:alpha/beta hydrolase n=1 Tax=Polymorphobacter sp. PAMC 29334 TaxID=2862331 RepID=UPI001C67CD14|nr:alpha/beta fold hydrolase [Polymorphobacter sp. PAMC 29334]QYE33263.1 alpha/beta hydrolase [Polymorphobacter sp. PAMC 29334]
MQARLEVVGAPLPRGRRAGWNVLTIHYRGSWGGPGSFSFAHCFEDAEAALYWIREAARDAALRLDPGRIVLAGHSMGGFVAAHVAAGRSEVQGAAMISGVDLGRSFGSLDWNRAVARVDDNVGTGAGLHILAGTSPGALADEARSNADHWRLANYAACLAGRKLLLVTSNDGSLRGAMRSRAKSRPSTGRGSSLATSRPITATRTIASRFRSPFSAGWHRSRRRRNSAGVTSYEAP